MEVHIDIFGKKSQTDYSLVIKKNSPIKNIEAYGNFARTGSDHHILSAHIKLVSEQASKLYF